MTDIIIEISAGIVCIALLIFVYCAVKIIFGSPKSRG